MISKMQLKAYNKQCSYMYIVCFVPIYLTVSMKYKLIYFLLYIIFIPFQFVLYIFPAVISETAAPPLCPV